MAGARDLRRATAKIREEQRRRNEEARREREARLSALEDKAGKKPSETRRLANRRREEEADAKEIERDGHRVTGSGVKGDFGAYPNKMAGAADSTKGLDAIAFGSRTAKKDAEAAGLTVSDFMGSSVAPSGENGYLTGDVREIIAERDEA